MEGLSPRVRGIPPPVPRHDAVQGSIPACTGNPIARRHVHVQLAVYPRVYGESGAGDVHRPLTRGLSPRVRGIPPMAGRFLEPRRSIPACTGNPPADPGTSTIVGVYPRVYGESALDLFCGGGGAGLSPRVRGIHWPPEVQSTIRRSIPACTGNPLRRLSTTWPPAVYPRVYGESSHACLGRQHRRGLSPRVRGIQHRRVPGRLARGSIPACTGNPASAPDSPRRSRVYPRVYGESQHGIGGLALDDGLSPRVRGILEGAVQVGSVEGSIPACTGNPSPGLGEGHGREVYPRVYGESIYGETGSSMQAGLSPRVRGIRLDGPDAVVGKRSIPACTGNPLPRRLRPGARGVYPRVYGESIRSRSPVLINPGLSPRVRGIPDRLRHHRGRERSIPACTGNPRSDAPTTGL